MKTNSDDEKVIDLDNYFDKGMDELKNSINNDSKKNNNNINQKKSEDKVEDKLLFKNSKKESK